MKIKQSVINTFDRVEIPYKDFDNIKKDRVSRNRFSGETCETTELINYLISWVYETSNAYEQGDQKIRISDFDRIRYFILEQDSNAFNTCID